MKQLISNWCTNTHDIKSRYFIGSPQSNLRIHDIVTKADSSVQFTWTYEWMDLGMYSRHSRTVTVRPWEYGMLRVAKSPCDQDQPAATCDLASLEDTCFHGECDKCCRDNLIEITNGHCF